MKKEKHPQGSHHPQTDSPQARALEIIFDEIKAERRAKERDNQNKHAPPKEPTASQPRQHKDRNSPSEVVDTNYGIKVRINYLPNPIAVQLVSMAKPREIYSVLCRKQNQEMTYIVKSEYQSCGEGRSFGKRIFLQLYSAPWLEPKGIESYDMRVVQAKKELDAVREAARKRRESIENYLGEEILLD